MLYLFRRRCLPDSSQKVRCDCSWCETQPPALLWHPAPLPRLSRDPAQLDARGIGPGDERLSLLGPLGDLSCLVCAVDDSSGSGHSLAGLWAVCRPALRPMWRFSLVPSSWCETLSEREPASALGVGSLQPGSQLCSGIWHSCSPALLFGEEGDAFGSPGWSWKDAVQCEDPDYPDRG